MSIYAYQLLKVMGLSEQRLLRVMGNIQVRSLDPDHVICRQGVRLDVFSHVLSGLVGAGVPCQDGTIIPIHIAGPGSWFGVDAILNLEAVALETICLTPVRMLVMPLADAVEAFEQEPRFAQYLAQLVSWRNQLLIDRLTLMRLGSPQLRVVMGLALFVQSFNIGNTNQLSSELADCQEIPLKQSLLASMCGVSRGVFSESVQQLASAGLIRLSYGTLSLSRVYAWHKFSSDHSKNRHDNKMSMPAILKLMSESDPD